MEILKNTNKKDKDMILTVRHVSHRYHIQWAVRDISLEVASSGIYGLLGSNGAGKSTLMNIMCGVLSQSKGQILIKGLDIQEDAVEAKRHIGFLPQKPPLQMDLTVEEFLEYSAELRKVPEREIKEAVNSTVRRCSLESMRKRLIRNLSGGYQQRVGIAQAIIHNPDLVVLDEPTNGLDPNQILEIRQLIKDIARERTVILSTHILAEVQAMCGYIYMIEHGNLIFSGSVKDFNNYIQPDKVVLRAVNIPSPDILEEIKGVLEAEETEPGRYRLHVEDVEDTVERIVCRSVENGWRLKEINIVHYTMDEIFAALSKQS